MSSQGYEYWERRIIRDRETEALEQRSKSAEDAKWRVQTMLASVMPSSSDRVIDWRRM
jgi:hypothetical protein